MARPTILLYLALAAYVPFTLACFWFLPGRRAMLLSLVSGWLLLPWFDVFGRSVPLLHSKAVFVPATVTAASLLLDAHTWRGLRFRAFDLPVLALSVSPFFTSVATGLGAYDGASALVESSLLWGAPYLLGRVYLGSLAALLDGAKAIVLSGLVSLPLVLWEVRMSPQLHRQLYGFHQHSFVQHIRDGHYRPMLFLQHGLMVGMLMAAASLVAFWLWRTRSAKEVAGIRLCWAAPALLVGTFLCRTAGAFALLFVGLAVLETTRWVRGPLLALALALVPTAYCSLRIAGWDPAPLVTQAERWFGPARAQSLEFRLANERNLIVHDLQREWLGWGRWNDSRLIDEDGRDTTVIDSLWIITFGITGLVGLACVGAILALPLLRLVRAIPAQRWGDPRAAPAAALAVTVGIWAVDGLFNAMMSPMFPMLSGAVLSFCAWVTAPRDRGRAVPLRDPAHSVPPAAA